MGAPSSLALSPLSPPLRLSERRLEDAGGRLDGRHGRLVASLILDQFQGGGAVADGQAGAAGEGGQAVVDLREKEKKKKRGGVWERRRSMGMLPLTSPLKPSASHLLACL